MFPSTVPRSNLSKEMRQARSRRPANRALCFGNLAKALLIRLHLPREARVLEFGCGPATNILKLEASRPSYVAFVDNDPAVIASAQDRLRLRALQNPDTRLRNYTVHCLDFLREDILATLTPNFYNMDCILAFYSLHYIASSPEKARNFFQTCYTLLRFSRGTILAILPNAERLCVVGASGLQNRLFTVQGLGSGTPVSGSPYTFQVVDERSYFEYLLFNRDLMTAMEGLFVQTTNLPVLSFLEQASATNNELYTSLLTCIVGYCPNTLTQQEIDLINLYDVVILNKIV